MSRLKTSWEHGSLGPPSVLVESLCLCAECPCREIVNFLVGNVGGLVVEVNIHHYAFHLCRPMDLAIVSVPLASMPGKRNQNLFNTHLRKD